MIPIEVVYGLMGITAGLCWREIIRLMHQRMMPNLVDPAPAAHEPRYRTYCGLISSIELGIVGSLHSARYLLTQVNCHDEQEQDRLDRLARHVAHAITAFEGHDDASEL